MCQLNLNGVVVPVRVWTGTTGVGTRVEVLVVAVLPLVKNQQQLETLCAELPPFMLKSSDLYQIKTT